MRFFYYILIFLALTGCAKAGGAQTERMQSQEPSAKPSFCADSAYAFVAQQCAFGPRVPGSPASKQCAQWLLRKLAQYGASDVTAQQTQLSAYDGTILDATNISARFNPQAQERVLLMAHWDSRPWADQDSDPASRYKPIDGANDGASGVGVILEVARQISLKQPRLGVDVLLVDAEDYGPHADHERSEEDADAWALGAQHWVANPTFPLTDIKYGVLLDMVGGKDAKFYREYHSEYAAKAINDRVWSAARKAGEADRFIDGIGGAVVDDHVYLLMAGVPVIDIIDAAHPQTGSFPPTWHTSQDNMENIDRATLQAVGNTMLQLIY